MNPDRECDLDLVVAGELNPDILVSGGDVRPRFGQVEALVDAIRLEIGSSSAITACGAARLGLRTAFVGVVGDDPLGRFVLDAMAERDVDVSRCRIESDIPTGATVILTDGGDRAMLTALGTIATLRGSEIPDHVLARARHLHVGSTFLQPELMADLPSVFERAVAAGLTTSFDCNWDPTGQWDAGIDAVLAVTDAFLPNHDEALRITRCADVEGAAAALVRRASASGRRADRPISIAIKLGADGALAVRGGSTRVVRVPGPRVDVVDTTGAGDSFNAGFLYGLLRDWTLDRTLSLAVTCGSLSVRGLGGTAAQPTLREALGQ